MKNIFVVIPLFLLSACASLFTSSSTLPNGTVVHTVRCNGYNQTEASCHAQADKICTNGYKEHKNLAYRQTHADAGDGIHMPTREYMVVECK